MEGWLYMQATAKRLILASMALPSTVIAQSNSTVNASLRQVDVRQHVVVEVTITNQLKHAVVLPDLRGPNAWYLFHIQSKTGEDLQHVQANRLFSGSVFLLRIEAGETAKELVTLDALFKELPDGVYGLQLSGPIYVQTVTSQTISVRVDR